MFDNRWRGDTAHFNLAHLVRCSNLGGDIAQNVLVAEAGTPHILLEGIWLDIVIREGGTPHRKKCTLERGYTAHTILMRGTIGVGTMHNIPFKWVAILWLGSYRPRDGGWPSFGWGVTVLGILGDHPWQLSPGLSL